MLAVLIVGLTLSLAPQATDKPPSASIRGRVTDEATGRPVRMARIALVPSPRARAAPERFTRTADDGTYQFRELPAGRFTLTVSKPRYVTLEHGQKLPAPSGIVLAVEAGGVLDRVDVHLPRAAAITGRVRDELGETMQGAAVSAMRVAYSQRGRSLVPVGTASTNDAGEYRIAQLQPGEYYVVAAERGDSFGSEPDADIGFLKTAYPSSASLASARLVPVLGGHDTTRIDIAMLPARAAPVAGRVITASGLPAANAWLVLQSIGEGPGSGLGSDTRSGSDGSFLIPNVVAGPYEMHVRLSGKPSEGAVLSFVATGEPVTNWTIPVTVGGRMRGRVVPPANAGLVRPADLSFSAVPVSDTLMFGTGFGGPIKDDWTFDWDFLLGRRVIRHATLPPGWSISAVMRGDEDITDVPVVFNGAEVVENLEILLTTDSTSIVGTTTGEGGVPAADYTVIAFSDDADKWTPWSRFIKSARPDDKKQFRIEGLPPDRYRIAALTRVENLQWLDRDFLEKLRPDALPLTLDPGQALTVTLTVKAR
jgi:hypothetical protein